MKTALFPPFEAPEWVEHSGRGFSTDWLFLWGPVKLHLSFSFGTTKVICVEYYSSCCGDRLDSSLKTANPTLEEHAASHVYCVDCKLRSGDMIDRVEAYIYGEYPTADFDRLLAQYVAFAFPEADVLETEIIQHFIAGEIHSKFEETLDFLAG